MSSVTRTVTAPARPRTVATVLLDRRATVYLPPVEPTPTVDPVVEAGVILLEADVFDRGFLLSAALHQHLARLDVEPLTDQGLALLADLDAAVGNERPMEPQFRGFPRQVPADTLVLWVDRVLSYLFQHPEQPCVLCGTAGEVHAVSPCAHLVCRSCFDGGVYSGCPICHRRIDPDDPFLRAAPERPLGGELPLPARARVLALGSDATAAARSEVDTLLARGTALPPQDRDDLIALLNAFAPDDLSFLPDEIPARETKALVLAWLIDERAAQPAAWAAVSAQLGTATDALRLLVARSGGDAGLVGAPRFGPVARPLRRAVLGALDRLDPRALAEDLGRHRRLWIHAAERLHPFEHAATFPRAAAGFAVLRGTALGDDRLGRSVRETAHEAGFEPAGAGIRHTTFAGRVERLLGTPDVPGAARLLAQRPGEFMRRLDQLLRLAVATGTTHAVLERAPVAAASAAPAVLLGALGELRVRRAPHERRVFFPKGGSARAHVVDDPRPPLPAEVVSTVEDMLVAELVARCAQRPAVEVALVDRALHSLVAPFTQRTASRALLTLPRGSAVTIPAGPFPRLFLHWMESDQRVDLDLSAAFFDEAWTHLGTCDYTSLRFADTAAVHSGDFTSAPAPTGAAEFLDLDTAALAAAGARYAVLVVYSYNNVAFDDMAEAFAGVMLREGDPQAGAVFEPRAVEQRFDLAGRSRSSVPFVLDLATRELRWLDMAQGVTGTNHAVHDNVDQLATMGRALTELYRSGVRVGLGELAVWHAAARAATVLVREESGRLDAYRRRDGEDPVAFADRIARGEADESGVPVEAPVPLAFVYRADIPVAEGGEAYALLRLGLSADTVHLLDAADLAASLDPA